MFMSFELLLNVVQKTTNYNDDDDDDDDNVDDDGDDDDKRMHINVLPLVVVFVKSVIVLVTVGGCFVGVFIKYR